MSVDKDTKIKEYLMNNFSSSEKSDFAPIDSDYTFEELYDDLKSHNDINSKLNIEDEDTLRSVLAKIWFNSGSKFKFSEEMFYQCLPLNCWPIYLMFDVILRNLTEENNYHIYAHDTHRWISCDGWYELEYNLQDDNGLDVYITTYSSYEQDFEDEWSSEGGHNVSYSEVYCNDYDWTPRYALCNFIENEQVRKDMKPEFVAEIERRFKK